MMSRNAFGRLRGSALPALMRQRNIYFNGDETMSTAFTNNVENKIRSTFGETMKLPLMGPDNMPTPHYGICRTDIDGPEAWFPRTMKRGYQEHTLDDVVDICRIAAEGFGLQDDQIKVDCCWGKNGHRVSIAPTNEHRRTLARGDDSLWPRFVLRADFGFKFIASAGMFRDACSNLQMMRKVRGTTVSLRHTGGFRDHFDSTVEEFRTLAAKYDDIVEAANKLNERRVDTADFLAEMFPPPAKESSESKHTRHKRQIQQMINRLQGEQAKTGVEVSARSATPWQLENMVTGFIQHDKTRVGKPNASERAFLALDDKTCDKAWDLAFAMSA